MRAKVFCENIFNEVLPSIRAIISNRLTNIYGLTQMEVSEKLGLTQPAVSQYKSGLRGKGIKRILANKDMINYIDSLSAEIISDRTELNTRVCEICQKSRRDGIFPKDSLDHSVCLVDISKEK